MNKNYRYDLGTIRLEDLENLLTKVQCYEMVEGCLLDSYRFYNVNLKWQDYMGKHNCHFDELLIFEKYVNNSKSELRIYGIKYRGITEDEQALADKFDAMQERQDELEEAM